MIRDGADPAEPTPFREIARWVGILAFVAAVMQAGFATWIALILRPRTVKGRHPTTERRRAGSFVTMPSTPH